MLATRTGTPGGPPQQVGGVGVERVEVDHRERRVEVAGGVVEAAAQVGGRHRPSLALVRGRPAQGAWSNWAGNQRADGVEVVSPSGTDGIAAALTAAAASGRGVRPVGSGHSFSPVAVPREVQLRLDRHDAWSTSTSQPHASPCSRG